MKILNRIARRLAPIACAAAAMLCAAAAPAWAQGTGNGLLGEYYDNQDFTGTRTPRVDTTVNFNWSPGTDVLPGGMANTTYSVRWRGQVQAMAAGNYVFTISSDDGTRLYLDGVLIVGTNWRDQGNTARSSAAIALAANSFHDITMEFYQGGGGTEAHLYWSGPPSATNVIIPQTQLYSGSVLANPTVTPNGGTLAGPQPVTLAGPAGSTLYYTLDGTDPCPAGPTATALNYTTTGAFNVSTYTQVRVRAYQAGQVASDMVTAFFSPQMDPSGATAGTTIPQVYFEYMRVPANLIALPNLAPLLVEQRGLVQQPTMNVGAAPAGLPARPQGTNFAYTFTGYIDIPAADTYTFYTSSNAASKLFIGSNAVVFNDGDRSFNIEQSGQIFLKAGYHSFTLLSWYRDQGTAAVNLSWQSSTITKAVIPAASLHTDPLVATPLISPAAGPFNPSVAVSWTSTTPNATFFFTTDGSVPDPRAAGGTGTGVTLTNTATVQVLAVAPGFNPSVIATSTFTRTGVGPIPLSVSAAGVANEILVTFNKPIKDTTVAPGAFTLGTGTVSNAAIMPRTGILAARWKLDDATGADSSGNTNNGTFSGTTANSATPPPLTGFVNPTDATPNVAQAFNGTNTSMSVPDSASLNVGFSSFTVAGWFLTTSNTTNQTLIQKWDAAANGSTGLGWRIDNVPNGQLRLTIRDTAQRNFNTAANGLIAANNTWYHLAVRWDKLTNLVSYYRNGVLIQNSGADLNFESLSNTVALQMGSGANGFFTGSMDDVRLYRVALTTEEILALFLGSDHLNCSVKLTTGAAQTAGAANTLNVGTALQDYLGTAVNAGTSAPFKYFGTGNVVYERWGDYNEGTGTSTVDLGGGGSVGNLTQNALFPNEPTFGSLLPTIDLPQNNSPNLGHYGARARGFFIAPTTNNFNFAIAADDGSKLFLSPDEEPSNKVLIAYSNGYNGYRAFQNAAGNIPVQSSPIPLVAGKKYYIEAYYKEGTGGDHFSVAINVGAAVADNTRPIGDPLTVAPYATTGANIAPYIDPMIVLTSPVNRAVQVGGSITLTSSASGTATTAPPSRIQWQKNGVDIPGATFGTLTLTNMTATDAGNYTVVYSNSVNVTTTPIAIISVNDDPTLTISPASGPIAGGQTVTITGSGLNQGSATVTFGGVLATNVSVTGNTLTCTTPAHALGTVVVVVATSEETSSLTYNYLGVPTVSSIVPFEGPATSQSIVINGTNFSPVAAQNVVNVNGTTTGVTVTNATTTALTVTIPASPTPAALTTVPVTVTTTGGGPVGSSFTYYPPPTITSLNPPAGATTGLSVTINGLFYSTATNATTVSWNGANVPITNITTTTVTVTAPASPTPGAITPVNVIVTAPGGLSNTAVYTYYPPATVSGISITEGATGGGYSAVISGTNFSTVNAQNSVTFGAAGVAAITGSTNTTITVTVPALAPPGASPTTVTVAVVAPGGSGNTSFTYYPPPTITNVTPNSGANGGGDNIVITGTNFSPTGTTTVTINGTAATVTNVTQTSITATTPARVPPAVAISPDVLQVNTTGGNATSTFTYYPAPTFTNITPSSSGLSQGGEQIFINGNFFQSGNTTVTFGGVAGTVTNVTATQITVITPGHDTAVVPVVVNAPGGSVSAGNFTFHGPRIVSIVPNSGPIAGGQSVVITGSGFVAGSTTLNIGGTAIGGLAITPTTITFTTPAHASGTFTVTVSEGGDDAVVVGGYQWLDTSEQYTITLDRGPVGGGQTVTIVGKNFSVSGTTVTIGGLPATGVTVAPNGLSLTCVTPAHAAGLVPVQVAVFGINSIGALNYTYVAPPTLTAVVPSKGPIAGGQTITLTGTNLEAGGQTRVSFGGGAPIVATYVSATSVTVVTPAHAAGPVQITVSTFTPAQGTGGNSVTYTYVDPATVTDLDLTLDVDNATPALNANVTLTIQIHNTSTINATGVSVRDQLPAGLTFVSSIPSVGNYNAGTGVWTVGSMAASATATLQITAKVTSSATLIDIAEISACDQNDVDSTPNNGIPGEDDYKTVTVSAGLFFQTPAGPLGTATQGAPFTRQFTAIGGVPTYSWSLIAAPDVPPLNLNPVTGVLSGTVPSNAPAQTYTFTIRVTDSAGTFVNRTFSILVNASSAVAPVIDATPVPPAGVVGVPYSWTFTANTGAPPYTFSVSAGTLPTGLSLNALTGTLAGTPTTVTGSPFNFTIQATNTSGNTTQAFLVAINPNPLRILTTTLPDAASGVPYSQTIEVVGGIGPTFTWSIVSGALPAPVTITGTGRVATVSGSPASSGVASFTVQVLDGAPGGASDTQTYTIAIAAPGISFVPTSAPTPPAGTLGRPFSVQMTGIGGILPYTWAVTGGVLPAGVTLNAGTGLLSGTPLEAGSFQIAITGTSSNSQSGTSTMSITIAPPPLITSPDPLPAAVGNEAYFYQMTASGGASPLSWTMSGALPTGLTLNQYSGVISGIPTAAGAGPTITVTDANGATDAAPFTLSFVNPAGALAMVGSLPPAYTGVPYSATVQAVGGTAPYTFSLLGTCPGLTFDANSHTLSGIPTGQPVGTVQIQLVDNVLATVLSNALVVTVPLDITQTTLGGGTLGQVFNVTLTAAGATAPLTWTVASGTLPPSLTLNSTTGALTGTLSQLGTSTFQVQVTDATGAVSQQQFTFTVSAAGSSTGNGSSSSGGGGGGCGLLGVELLLLYALRRRRQA